MEIAIPGFRAEADAEATRAWYAHEGDEWYCMCGRCRNFVALAKRRELPADLLDLLDRLSIPPEKATYVCEMDGEGLYELCWNVSGRLLEKGGKAASAPWGDWSLADREDQYQPSDAYEDFPDPCFILHVFARLPWALDEPMDIPRPKEHYIPVQGAPGETCAFLRKVIAAALAAEGVDFPCEIDVEITDDAGIHAINKEMRDVDAPTDVLSFPAFDLTPGELPDPDEDMDPGTGYVPLGDMAISLERARAQAAEYGHSERRELAYLAVHSTLHLLGYDHLDEGPMKAQMRAREEVIMEALGLPRA